MSTDSNEPTRDNTSRMDSSFNINITGPVNRDINAAQGNITLIHNHIGDNVQADAITNETVITTDASQALETILAELTSLIGQKLADPQTVDEAKQEVTALVAETARGDQVDRGFLEDKFRVLAAMGPEILDVVTATLINPAAGFATVVRKIAEKAQQENARKR